MEIILALQLHIFSKFSVAQDQTIIDSYNFSSHNSCKVMTYLIWNLKKNAVNLIQV